MFPGQLRPRFAWLEITGLCNLDCRHCYAESSPQGDHGDMTETDWMHVIDQLDEMGVRDIQFIGGEPTLHPGLSRFIRHAGKYAMRIEVFSNMTHIKPEVWDALKLPGVRLAFSYYSDEASGHEAVTGTRGSHVGTRTNVQRARELGIRDVRTDRIRPFGRGADGKPPLLKGLCGMCGRAKFAVLPDGRVTPCVFSRWMELGNVHRQTLAEIYSGEAMNAARADLEREFPHTAPRMAPTCLPECNPSFDSCSPQTVCAPDAACGPTGSGDDGGGSGSLPRTDS